MSKFLEHLTVCRAMSLWPRGLPMIRQWESSHYGETLPSAGSGLDLSVSNRRVERMLKRMGEKGPCSHINPSALGTSLFANKKCTPRMKWWRTCLAPGYTSLVSQAWRALSSLRMSSKEGESKARPEVEAYNLLLSGQMVLPCGTIANAKDLSLPASLCHSAPDHSVAMNISG